MTDMNPGASRRDFLKTTSTVATASALAGVAVPSVHAAGNDLIRLALIGCGGRGTGAVNDALKTAKQGPIKLVAMADVFKDRLDDSFDAYRHAMDCLKPGDVVILATQPAFRWVHFTYAIEKDLNTFMEKPIAVDGPTSRRMIALGEEAKKKNLKVGVGLMCRHCDARQELFSRIKDGQLGEILMLRAY